MPAETQLVAGFKLPVLGDVLQSPPPERKIRPEKYCAWTGMWRFSGSLWDNSVTCCVGDGDIDGISDGDSGSDAAGAHDGKGDVMVMVTALRRY